MDWIYLSPHLDDVAFSCGGLIWQQTQAGESVTILTICAGDPPDRTLSLYAQAMHAQWGLDMQAPSHRRLEDQEACRILGAAWDHRDVPDCIYRFSPIDNLFYYTSDEALFGPLHPGETPLIATIRRSLMESLPADAILVCPLAIGGHVDHRLARSAAEGLDCPLWYYADVPYVLQGAVGVHGTLTMDDHPEWVVDLHPISSDGMEAWFRAAGAHGSQVPVFWEDENEMRSSLRQYCQQVGGLRLWQRKPGP